MVAGRASNGFLPFLGKRVTGSVTATRRRIQKGLGPDPNRGRVTVLKEASCTGDRSWPDSSALLPHRSPPRRNGREGSAGSAFFPYYLTDRRGPARYATGFVSWAGWKVRTSPLSGDG